MGIVEDTAAPDFQPHPWRALSCARLDGAFVELAWPDGTRHRAHHLWLRENTVGVGIDPLTREGVLDIASLPADARVGAVAIDASGALVCTFEPGGETAALHPGWLHEAARGRHRPDALIPTPVPWIAGGSPTAPSDSRHTEGHLVLRAPPTHEGPAVLVDDGALEAWVDDLVSHGLARLTGLPRDHDLLARLTARLGPIRDTNFGAVWDVRADVPLDGAGDSNSTANTRRRLTPHTDLPTREVPPGFQFLHCLENTTSGGESTMTDGLALNHRLATRHPEHHEALTTLRWTFSNRNAGHDHRWSAPIIEEGDAGSPITLRAFWALRAVPDMAEGDVERAYAAIKCLSELAASPEFQIRYPFAPGDVVAFDNRRILHGREAFSRGGTRHLRGTYLDHDEVHSFVRVAARRRAHRDLAHATDPPVAEDLDLASHIGRANDRSPNPPTTIRQANDRSPNPVATIRRAGERGLTSDHPTTARPAQLMPDPPSESDT